MKMHFSIEIHNLKKKKRKRCSKNYFRLTGIKCVCTFLPQVPVVDTKYHIVNLEPHCEPPIKTIKKNIYSF